MGQSQKKKRDARKFAEFRDQKNIFRCQDCGKKLSYETHHFLCNECHEKRKKEKKKRDRYRKFKKYGCIDLR